ncbi:MAG: hypothetical protein ACRDIE_11125 [Chloroflexota bacterium]
MKHLTWRTIAVLLLTVALGAAAVGPTSSTVHAKGAANALTLVAPTKVIIFHPKGFKGAPVAGNCGMGESLALNRSDAWRCIVGNEIYDPCFSTSAHATWVICDASPKKPVGIKVTLPKPLPTHGKAKDKQPWMLTLGDGVTCGFVTGGTFGIGNQRANYGCTKTDWIIGSPVPGKVWYAVRAHMNGKSGPNGPIASHVWAQSVASVVL